MQPNDYQARQKAILTSEIRILEKQKRDIESELEHIEATKKEEYTQYTKQIKDLTNRKNELLEQVERLRDAMTTMTAAYETAKQSLEEFSTKMRTEAKEELHIAQLAAERVRSIITQEKMDADLLLDEAKRTKADADLLKEAVEVRERENIAYSNSLATRQKMDLEKHQLAQDRLHKLIEEEEKLKTSIDELTHQKAQLEINIARHTETYGKRIHEFEEREKGILVNEQANIQRSKMLDMSEGDLREEARKINDRRATLDRAVEEMKKKGAKI